MNKPMVSIIIPVYNREKIILESLKSASSQTYKNIEIIVVDNCSTDNTFNICKEYTKVDNRVKLYKNNENIGPVRNWIEGINKAKGDYIKIIWSDDWIDDNYIEECMKLMRENVGFVFTPAMICYMDDMDKNLINYNIYDRNKIFDKNIFIEKSILIDSKYLLPVSPGCALFRRKDLKINTILEIENKEGLIFNNYGAGNDLLMFLLTLNNPKYTKVAYCNSTLAYFRAHKDSFSISNDLCKYYDYSRAYFLKKYNDKKLSDKFKSNLFLKKIKKKDYDILFKYTVGNIKIKYIIKFVVNKFFY